MSVISKGATLSAGQSLRPGECLTSPNGRYRLELQASDGNLVLYHQHANGGQQPTWATMTQKAAGHADFARELAMQTDGNLVLYRAGNHEAANSRWSSATNKNEYRGARLELQNDGNLVIYVGDKAAWSSGSWSNAHWMEALDAQLTLQNICVPGSHDAGMYTTKLVPGVGARGLALTQDLSIYEQLRQGSRYFDLRPRHIDGKGFYIFHGMADGPKLEVVLDDLKRFFDEGSAETVMVEFSHWEDFGGQDAAFIKMVLDKLPASCLLKPADLVKIRQKELAALRKADPKLTIKTDLELLAQLPALDLATLPLGGLRGKLLVLIDNDSMYANVVQKDHKEGIYSRKHQLPLYDSYSNQQDYDDMVRDQTDKFKKFSDKAGLFMLNWTLTPLGPDSYDVGNVAWVAGPAGWLINQATKQLLPLAVSSSVETYAERINPKLKDAPRNHPGLFGRNAAQRMVNIINLDYMHTADAVRVCQQLIAANNKKP